MKKPQSQMSHGGAAFLVTGSSLFLIGWLLDDSLLMTFGFIAVVLLAIGYIVGRRNVKGMKVAVEMPSAIHSGAGADSRVVLHNTKRLQDTVGAEVRLKLIHEVSLEGRAQWVLSDSEAVLGQRFSIPRRGSLLEVDYRVISSFPMRLFKHQFVGTLPLSMVVYPRMITPVEILAHGALSDADPKNGAHLGDSHGEPRGVRPWQAGDPAKRIHWPASARSLARGQGLRVREYDPPGFLPKSCAVVFHSYAKGGEVLRADRFERAISLVAGTLRYLHSRGVKASFVADFMAWQERPCFSRAQFIDCLALLAEANRSMGTEGHELQAQLDSLVNQYDQVVVVSDISPTAWRDDVKLAENVLVVDIRQIRFRRKRLSGQQMKVSKN